MTACASFTDVHPVAGSNLNLFEEPDDEELGPELDLRFLTHPDPDYGSNG